MQLAINAYFVRAEAQQYLTGIFEYLSDIWNVFDFSVSTTIIIITNTCCRLCTTFDSVVFVVVPDAVDAVVSTAARAGDHVLRLLYWRETTAPVIVLSFTSIFMWFNILYYLRALQQH